MAGGPFYQHVTEPDSAEYLDQGKAVAKGDWLGHDVFKMSPLYRYLLGLILMAGGNEVFSIRAVQLVVGALNCGLVYLIGRNVFGAGPGLLAGLVMALYRPAIFYESKILNEVWVIAANLAATLCLVCYRKQQKAGRLGLCGLFLGLSCILRANGLLLTLLFGLIALLYAINQPRKTKVFQTCAFIGGWLVATGPVFLRNWLVGGQFVLLVTNLGPEFYLGSHPENLGLSFEVPYFIAPNPVTISEGFREQAMVALGQDLSHEAASRYWVWETLKAITADPGGYFHLLFRKMGVALNHFEPTDNTVYEYEWRQSNVLAWMFPGFGLLFALAGPGLVWALRKVDIRTQWPLFGALAAYAASMIMASVIGRYRLPAVPILCLFAGLLVVASAEWLRHRRWLSLLVCFWGFSACLGFGFHENTWIKKLKRERMAEAFHRLAVIHLSEGKGMEAMSDTQQAIDWHPEGRSRYVIPGLPYERANPFQVAWKRRHAQRHHRLAPSRDMLMCATILEEGGNSEAAAAVLRRAMELFDDKPFLQDALMGVLWRSGRIEELQATAQLALEQGVGSALAAYYLALGGPDAAQADFFKPSNGFEAWHFGRLELQNGRFAQASRLLQKALERDLAHSAETHLIFARCCSALADYAEAQEHLETAEGLDPDYRRYVDYEQALIALRSKPQGLTSAKPEELYSEYLRGWRLREALELKRQFPSLPSFPGLALEP